MPNSLEIYIETMLRDDENAVMNILQEHMVVSDNAVQARDVYNAGEAVAWIERNPQFFRRGLVKTKKNR